MKRFVLLVFPLLMGSIGAQSQVHVPASGKSLPPLTSRRSWTDVFNQNGYVKPGQGEPLYGDRCAFSVDAPDSLALIGGGIGQIYAWVNTGGRSSSWRPVLAYPAKGDTARVRVTGAECENGRRFFIDADFDIWKVRIPRDAFARIETGIFEGIDSLSRFAAIIRKGKLISALAFQSCDTCALRIVDSDSVATGIRMPTARQRSTQTGQHPAGPFRLVDIGHFLWDGGRVTIFATSEGQVSVAVSGYYRDFSIMLNPDDSVILEWADSTRDLLTAHLPKPGAHEVAQYDGSALVGTGTGGEIQLVRQLVANKELAYLSFHDGASSSEVRVHATPPRLKALIRALQTASRRTREISPKDSP